MVEGRRKGKNSLFDYYTIKWRNHTLNSPSKDLLMSSMVKLQTALPEMELSGVLNTPKIRSPTLVQNAQLIFIMTNCENNDSVFYHLNFRTFNNVILVPGVQIVFRQSRKETGPAQNNSTWPWERWSTCSWRSWGRPCPFCRPGQHASTQPKQKDR